MQERKKQEQKNILQQLIPFFLRAPVFLWQIFFFFIPLLFIIALSLFSLDNISDNIYGLSFFKTFTLKYIISFFTPVYFRIIIRSLGLAFFTALICLCISYPLAYFLAFRAQRFKILFLFLLIVPFWTNFLLHIYAWFFVLERGGFLNTVLQTIGIIKEPLNILNSMLSVYIMMVYYYLPFMALPLYTVLEKFDHSLIEASLDLGATWLQTLRKVMLPLTLQGILSGFFLVFVPAFAEFAIPELMGGDKKMFVGTVVSHYILGGSTISYGAAFTMVSSVVLIMSALALFYCVKKFVKAF